MARLHPGPDRSFYITSTALRVLKELQLQFEIVRRIDPGDLKISILYEPNSILHNIPPADVREDVFALALSRRERASDHYPVYIGRSTVPLPDSFALDLPWGKRNYRWRWAHKPSRSQMKSMRQFFPNLVGNAEDKRTRFVMSLGSGGLRMFAHPAIFTLMNALGIKEDIDEIWGCSGGAIMGLAYALGAEASELEQFGYDLWQQRQDFRVHPSAMDITKNILLNWVVPGAAIDQKGFIDVRETMRDSLANVARYTKPSVPFYALTYNMNTKRNEVLTPMRISTRIYGDFIKHTSAINSILASSAIPVLHIPRIIKRGHAAHTYIDGSLFEEVPLSSIYRKWQLDRRHGRTKTKKLLILAVNLFPPLSTMRLFGRLPTKPFKFMRLLGIITNLIDLARRCRIQEQLQLVNTDPDAHVIELNLPRLSRRNCLDPGIIPPSIARSKFTFIPQLIDAERNFS